MKRNALLLLSIAALMAACSGDDEPRVGTDAGTPDTGGTLADMTTADAADSPDLSADDAGTSDTGAPDFGLDAGTLDMSTDTGGAAVTGTVEFPYPISMTYYTQVTVRGTAASTGTVAGVTVGGTDATSDDGFTTWEATVDLQPGLNSLAVVAEDIDGTSQNIQDLQVTQKTPLEQSAGTAWDPTGRWLYTIDNALKKIRRVNVDNGQIEVVTDLDDFVSSTWNRTPRDLAIDPAATELYMVSRDPLAARERGVWRYDLSSGSWFDVSTASTGSGVAWDAPWRLTVDGTSSNGYVFDTGANHVVAVDLATGDRSVLSSATVPNTDTNLLDRVSDVEFDATGDQILVADFNGTVFGIDASSGARTLIASDARGTGPSTADASSLGIDDAGRRAFLHTTSSPRLLLEIELATGNRREIPAVTKTLVSLAYDPTDDALHVIEYNEDVAVSIDVTSGSTSVIASNGFPGPLPEPFLRGCASANDEVFGVSASALLKMGSDNSFEVVHEVGGLLEGNLRYMASTPDGKIYILAEDGITRTLIYAYDPTTGALTTLVDRARTMMPEAYAAEAFHVTDAGDKAYIVNEPDSGYQLLEIDLATGDVTIVSDASHTSPVDFEFPTDISMDGANVLVADSGVLISVDSATGTRTVSALPAPQGLETLELGADGTYWYSAYLPSWALWRLPAGGSPLVPHVTLTTPLGFAEQLTVPYWVDADAPFISCDAEGISQIDRETGRMVWLVR